MTRSEEFAEFQRQRIETLEGKIDELRYCLNKTEGLTPKERLDNEIEELGDKLAKLEVFLRFNPMVGFSAEEQRLLDIQSKAMSTYLGILELRYKQFKV